MSTKMPFMPMPSMQSYAPAAMTRWIDVDAWTVNLCSGTTHVKRLTPGDSREVST